MNDQITGYQCETSIGHFFIMEQDGGKFHIIYGGRKISPSAYVSAEAALRDLGEREPHSAQLWCQRGDAWYSG